MSFSEIESMREELSREREGGFVGYNDPELSLVEHAPDPGEQRPGASGTESGFLFGGEVYRDARAAEYEKMPHNILANKGN